jgi:hypothetical protein
LLTSDMTNIKRKWVSRILTAWGLIGICSCAPGTIGKSNNSRNLVQIDGKISVKGTGKHAYLCLSQKSGEEYRLEGRLRDWIGKQYQQKTIRLQGVISQPAVGPDYPKKFIVIKVIDPSIKQCRRSQLCVNH